MTGYYRYPATGEQLTLNSRFAESDIGAFAEIGFSFGFPETGIKWLLGLRYNYAAQ